MLIDIPSIALDVENFRHGNVSTEREAIQKLLSDEKTHRVCELAGDIVELGGLDPSSRLIVMKDPHNDGKYIALEGNRRICALKTLLNPDLSVNLPTHSNFKKLSALFLDLNIKDVDCVILGRTEATQWIKRKHYNAMGGKGVMPWNAVATARSDASEGRAPRWMIALNFLQKNGISTDEVLDGIANKTTTVERVLASAHMGPILGLSFKDGQLIPENGNNQDTVTLLKAMFDSMADPNFTEPTVTSTGLQKNFIERFQSLSVAIPPEAPKNTEPKQKGEDDKRDDSKDPPDAGKPDDAGGSPTGAGAPPRDRPIRDRKKLAKSGLRIGNTALNRLYNELKKLSVETNPHVCAGMGRIFLEKATMVFLTEMPVPCPNPKGWHSFDVKLRTKVEAALRIVDPSSSNRELDYVRDVANGTQDKLHTLDYLNRAIHDHYALPSSSELVQIWERYHPYFLVIFETLERKGK